MNEQMDWMVATEKQAVRVLDVDVTPGTECVLCETKDGSAFDVNFLGTNLEGVLDDAATSVKPGRWAELGRRLNDDLYVLSLYTRDEFDCLSQHVMYARAVSCAKYKMWREMHRVPEDRCPEGVELYYGRRPLLMV